MHNFILKSCYVMLYEYKARQFVIMDDYDHNEFE